MTDKRFWITSGLLATLIPASALASFSVGDALGTDVAAIRAEFEGRGYQITEIETEDDEIEVEYLVDGTAYEVSISTRTGLITEVELEDDDGDDD